MTELMEHVLLKQLHHILKLDKPGKFATIQISKPIMYLLKVFFVNSACIMLLDPACVYVYGIIHGTLYTCTSLGTSVVDLKVRWYSSTYGKHEGGVLH